MRNRLLTLALASLLTAGVAMAQDNTASPQDSGQGAGQGQRGHGMMRPMDPDQELQHLTRQLDLTTDQQAQIKPLLVDHQQKLQALFQDQSLSRDDRRAKARAIGEEMHTKMGAILTDEQKQKLEAMMQRMHHGGGDNGAPPPASSQPQL